MSGLHFPQTATLPEVLGIANEYADHKSMWTSFYLKAAPIKMAVLGQARFQFLHTRQHRRELPTQLGIFGFEAGDLFF